MTRLKNPINFGGKNYATYADAASVEMFINSHIVNFTLIMKRLILMCSVESLGMPTTHTGVHRICQIEFSRSRIIVHEASTEGFGTRLDNEMSYFCGIPLLLNK